MSVQIDISFQNSTGEPTLSAGQANTMTLVLTNAGDPIAIGASTPAYPPNSGQFEIVVYLSSFYTDPSDQQNAQISGAGFAAQCYPDGNFPGWVLAATANQTWNTSESLSFTVANLIPDVPVSTYYLSVDVGYIDGSQGAVLSLPVMVQSPPAQGKTSLGVLFSFQPANPQPGVSANEVFITKNPAEPVENGFVLQLSNESPTTPLASGWGSGPTPCFTLSFVYGDAPGYYALTTEDLLGAIQVSAQDGGMWQVTQTNTSPPVWTLSPTLSNPQILGTGTQGIAEFNVTNVSTQFVPGPTLAYLQYTNIPGYDDGVIACSLEKLYAPVRVVAFQLDASNYTMPDIGYATGYLTWQADAAVMVQLECVPPVAPLEVNGVTYGYGQVASQAASYPVMIQQNQTFVLTAYDTLAGAVAAKTASATASPSLEFRWMPVGVITPWQGDASAVPEGYAICDGTNAQPDLSDLFVIGAGGQFKVGPMPVGGDTHIHALTGNALNFTTSQDGGHAHACPTSWYARNLTSGGKTGIDTCGTFLTSTLFQSVPDHDHTVSVDFGSVNSLINSGGVRPPWYALNYIIKTG